jgi:pimeloyl-ACP methyl ester carboxylesterase
VGVGARQYDGVMSERPGLRARVSRAIGVVLLVPLAIVGLLGVQAPWSPSGWVLLAAAGVVAASALAGSARVRRTLRASAAAAIGVLVIVRLLAAGAGMPTLPGATSSRWLGRVVDEQDVALLGARLLVRRWPLIREERDGLVREMGAAYSDMRHDAGGSPSPVVDTTFGRQGPDGFDTLVFEPSGPASSAGVVFLHGYGGSFRLECWMVAEAARAIQAITVCPATGFRGHWSGRDAERTLRAALDYLDARGIRRVYLAGLSNGAVGVGTLAPRFASMLSGLILISGAPSGGTAAQLPALVIHGERDRIASAAVAQAFAARTKARYLGLDGGHFVLLMRRAQVRDAIAGWLRQREEPR